MKRSAVREKSTQLFQKKDSELKLCKELTVPSIIVSPCLKHDPMCWTMEIYCVLTYQYSITVNNSVEPVSNSEDRTLLKLVTDRLLDETVGSKRNREHNTLAEKYTLPIDPWAGILLDTEQ